MTVLEIGLGLALLYKNDKMSSRCGAIINEVQISLKTYNDSGGPHWLDTNDICHSRYKSCWRPLLGTPASWALQSCQWITCARPVPVHLSVVQHNRQPRSRMFLQYFQELGKHLLQWETLGHYSSFPVIHKVGNIGILYCLNLIEKSVTCNSKHYDKYTSVLRLIIYFH